MCCQVFLFQTAPGLRGVVLVSKALCWCFGVKPKKARGHGGRGSGIIKFSGLMLLIVQPNASLCPRVGDVVPLCRFTCRIAPANSFWGRNFSTSLNTQPLQRYVLESTSPISSGHIWSVFSKFSAPRHLSVVARFDPLEPGACARRPVQGG